MLEAKSSNIVLRQVQAPIHTEEERVKLPRQSSIHLVKMNCSPTKSQSRQSTRHLNIIELRMQKGINRNQVNFIQ